MAKLDPPPPLEKPGPSPTTLTLAPPINTARCVSSSCSSSGTAVSPPARVNSTDICADVPLRAAARTCSISGRPTTSRSNSAMPRSRVPGSEPRGNDKPTLSDVRRSPNPPNDERGTFVMKPHVSTASTATAPIIVAARQRSSRISMRAYTRRNRGHEAFCAATPFPSAGTTSSAVNTLHPSANTNAAAKGTNAARVSPCRYKNGKSTTAVVSVLPTMAGMMRCVARARPSGVSGSVPRRSTTTRPFCTRMPTPMPSPASVSRFAGILNR